MTFYLVVWLYASAPKDPVFSVDLFTSPERACMWARGEKATIYRINPVLPTATSVQRYVSIVEVKCVEEVKVWTTVDVK